MGVVLGLASSGTAAADVVKTTAGSVKGTATADRRLRIYRSIPYAAPPVGELRWQAPRPAKPWQGVRDATEFGPRCLQGQIFADIVFRDLSEECLYLNVWTPAKSAGDRLPVMVWIYGGGFVGGMTSVAAYAGTRLAEKGVVLVSVAYRLGAFGFFVHLVLSRMCGMGSGSFGMPD